MTDRFLPYGQHSIDDADIAAVAGVLRSDFLTTGPAVERFERDFARAVFAPHAISCNSGTAALHLIAMALEVKPGDRVVVPAITFSASANAFRYQGAEIAFADVDPQTGLMTAAHLDAALDRPDAKGAKVAVVVHLAGQPADMVALQRVARNRGVTLVEDACHAIGASYIAGNQVAAVGQCLHSTMAAFSLHPVKTVAMGEGGVVTTSDADLARRVEILRSHGIERAPDRFAISDEAFDDKGRPHPWYYEMQSLGYNYRASDILCALGSSQLTKLERFVARRRALVDRYDRLFKPSRDFVRPLGRTPSVSPAWHLYVALFDFKRLGVSRADVMRRLRAKGIGTQVHYIPVPLQPYYRSRQPTALAFPGASAYYAQTLSLPLFPAMADDEVDRVVAAVAELGALD